MRNLQYVAPDAQRTHIKAEPEEMLRWATDHGTTLESLSMRADPILEFRKNIFYVLLSDLVNFLLGDCSLSSRWNWFNAAFHFNVCDVFA